MIKQLQLRGLSNNPSDRLTSDGGVAESLNFQIDQDENAPVFPPEDVCDKLGVPDDCTDEILFIHKTKATRRLIARRGDAVGFFDNKTFVSIFDLDSDETIKDIVSIGNTVVIASSTCMHYALLKGGSYKYLGTEIPFPEIEFYAKQYYKTERKQAYQPYRQEDPQRTEDTWPDWTREFHDVVVEPRQMIKYHTGNGEEWELSEYDKWIEISEINDDLNSGRTVPRRQKNAWFTKKITEIYQLQDAKFAEEGVFSYPVWVTYAVELYDGTRMCSCPVMMGAGFEYPYDTHVTLNQSMQGGARYIDMMVCAYRKQAYQLYYKIKGDCSNLSDWEDLITKVGFYTSTQIGEELQVAETGPCELVTDEIRTPNQLSQTFNCLFHTKDYSFEKAALKASQNFYLQETIEVNEVIGHDDSLVILPCLNTVRSEQMVVRERLTNHDFSRFPVSFDDLISINNRVVGVSGRRTLLMRNNQMTAIGYWDPALEETKLMYFGNARWSPTGKDLFFYNRDMVVPQTHGSFYYQYPVTFGALDGIDIGDRVIRTPDQWLDHQVYNDTVEIDGKEHFATAYAFFMCPDSRTKEAVISFTRTDVQIFSNERKVDMKAHPYQDLAYYYYNVERPMQNILTTTSHDEPTDITEELPNKIIMSDMDNPFYFPKDKAISIPSNIIKVAATSLPLSEGQLGQFTLYAFTDGGIYALESNDVGSIVRYANIAQEVATSDKAVLPLSQSVAFVTDKGLMMIQASTVSELSTNMRGKHYVMEDKVVKVLNMWHRNVKGVVDDAVTNFVSFLKGSEATYDYAGNRILFFRKDKRYAYVLKLGDMTWHKITLPEGTMFQKVLNSYPQAYVVLSGPDSSAPPVIEGGTDVDAPSDDELQQEETIIPDPIFPQAVYAESFDTVNHVYNFSTILDEIEEGDKELYGVIATRPFDLDAPDILKTITHLKIRGSYERYDRDKKPRVQYMLLGSQDGVNFHLVGSLRGKSWKMFRVIILAKLRPYERISWIDVEYETKFTNKIR